MFGAFQILISCMSGWKRFTLLESLEHQKEYSAARQMRRNHLLRRYFSIWTVELKLLYYLKKQGEKSKR